MQFDCFSPYSESQESQILRLTPVQSGSLKNGIIGFTPNLFAIPEGFTELELANNLLFIVQEIYYLC
jgi:hypothetical protein